MRVVTVHEAKTNLSRLIRDALDGEDIVIARGKTPLVRLTVIASAKPRRELGFAKGLISTSRDFDAPIPDFAEYER